jgi:hypothetical protein
MFVLVLDRVADLVVLGAHPSVVFVAVGVQSSKSLEAFLGFAVVDEPSGENVSTFPKPDLDSKGSNLGDSGNSMINNASTTAGMTCIPKANLHCIESSSAKF